jgi:hypothetical protein
VEPSGPVLVIFSFAAGAGMGIPGELNRTPFVMIGLFCSCVGMFSTLSELGRVPE